MESESLSNSQKRSTNLYIDICRNHDEMAHCQLAPGSCIFFVCVKQRLHRVGSPHLAAADVNTLLSPALECRQDLEKFGVGKVRTMEEWTEWSGVDFKDRSVVTAGDKFCVDDIPMDKNKLCPITQDARQRFIEATGNAV